MTLFRTFAFIFIMLPTSLLTQTDQEWFFLVAKDSVFNPTFSKQADTLLYQGNDDKLRSILKEAKIYQFKKTQRETTLSTRQRKFFVRTENTNLYDQLITQASHIFESGQVFTQEEKRIFEPNDYGLTSTIGDAALPVYLDYLDFLGVPKAWYYTTGSRDVIIGISDAVLDTVSPDFKDKTEILIKSSLSRGHGYSTSGNAAAQGDNGYGIPGICYDCSLLGVRYGNTNTFKNLSAANAAGAKIINCSWASGRRTDTGQDSIYAIINRGSIIVASAGNKSWQDTKGEVYFYPASHDKVISVSSVMYRHENPLEVIKYQKNGNPYVENIRGFLGRTAGFIDNDINKPLKIYPNGTATLNKDVDLLTPTMGLFAYSKFLLEDRIHYSEFETTSGASPLVSGTIGLMYSLCPCLPQDEVESILKMTSLNIDDIEVNAPYKGMYGAGILQTGDAVEMVYQLYSENETAYIQDQDFTRWNFKLTAFNDTVILQNQKFSDEATLDLTAKRQIVLKPNTRLAPNPRGGTHLKIDSTLQKSCELRLRDPSIVGKD